MRADPVIIRTAENTLCAFLFFGFILLSSLATAQEAESPKQPGEASVEEAERPDESPGLSPGTPVIGVAIGTPALIEPRLSFAVHPAVEFNIRTGFLLGVGYRLDIDDEGGLLEGIAAGLGVAGHWWFSADEALTVEGSTGISFSIGQSCDDVEPPDCNSRLAVNWDVLVGYTRQWDVFRFQFLGHLLFQKHIPRESEFETTDHFVVSPGLTLRFLWAQ